MAKDNNKVLVAMSGGVDSSTTAAILLDRGYRCEGVFMITCDGFADAQANAEEMAARLGIKLHVLDLRKDFEQILDYFCNEYRLARTPNPCVVCNRVIKFGKLLDFVRQNGAELLATGHYARILKTDRGTGLYETANLAKDQSYVLAMMERRVLDHIILPLGDYSKEQTKEMATKYGLVIPDRAESQEICFIPDDDYAAVLEKRCPEVVREGNIVDSRGNILGKHTGLHRFTIGQRRGLNVAMGKPYYVTKLDAAANTVTLGPKEEVMSRTLRAGSVNWLIDAPRETFRAKVKIRYNSPGRLAAVTSQGDEVFAEFDEPVSAITPGQVAVFYVTEGQNSRVAGGAWIAGSG